MTGINRRHFVAGSAGLAITGIGKSSAQSTWPTRPIRMVVPYPAGGQTDGIARAFGDYLSRQVGKPVVIENKAGAGGTIGVTDVKRADPDGHTILCTISSSLIQNRVTVKDLSLRSGKGFRLHLDGQRHRRSGGGGQENRRDEPSGIHRLRQAGQESELGLLRPQAPRRMS